MTSEEFRSDPMFLRNQFRAEGAFDLPIIKKQDISLEEMKLIGYNQSIDDTERKGAFVHFFMDDYKFEALWNNPEPRLERLSRFKGVLSPQFSTYYTMPTAMQVYNTFRSRWCGAYLQSCGITVIPTVSWGKPQSYWYCFDGIEKGSVVAVSTLGVKREKDFFLQGYGEMLRRIEPKAVICYCEPFPEMKGRIISIDYAQTNRLSKEDSPAEGRDFPTSAPNGFYIKKTCGYVISAGMGGGSGSIENPGFPGWDGTKSPGPGYEWRGSGDPKSGKGSWVDSKTKQSLHPDLNHEEPYGPHWDYKYPGGWKNGYRIFPDGHMTPKIFEGDDNIWLKKTIGG